jgi:UDP-glucose 6-dehydrogenase
LAYKPASHVVEESQGLLLAKALDRIGMRVVAYDPLANDAARAELRDRGLHGVPRSDPASGPNCSDAFGPLTI